MRTFFFILILLHGIIHLLGFIKAFEIAEISGLTMQISRIWGVFWLVAGLIFISTGVLRFLNSDLWWIAGIIGVILSQILIFSFRLDACVGSIPNLIILIFIISGFVHYTPPVSMMPEEFTMAPFEERYAAAEPVGFKQLINPFEISIEPMERLLLVNIENDPDTLYIGFEPQVFDDDKTGDGMLVIAWRADGKVDVYHQPTLSLDPAGYDIVGQGLKNMISRDMQGSFFEVNGQGVQASVIFEDIEGRLIELKLTEQSNRTRKPFGLLAPMGMAAENPSAMPLILLHDFYFVIRNGTELCVKINDRYHTPDTLPLPIDFTRMFFARYSPDPLIAKLNPKFDGVLTPIDLKDNFTLQHGEHIIETVLNRDIPEIRSISRSHNNHAVTLTFNPAFPNLNTFSGDKAEGHFEISGDTSTGFIRGEYSVHRSGERLKIEMIPSGGWIPNESKLSVRFLYSVQPIFKQWPTTYRWTAELDRDQDYGFRMRSNWERIAMDKPN